MQPHATWLDVLNTALNLTLVIWLTLITKRGSILRGGIDALWKALADHEKAGHAKPDNGA